MKVAVLGAAGGIGQALALLLKNRLPAGSELSLYDIAPVTPGVAADLSHIPTDVKVKGFCGEDPSPALVGADVVLISAGVARKPGMDRSDLFNINAGIVKNLVEKCAVSCPKALIGIITNRDLQFERELDRPIAEAMTREGLVTAPIGTTLDEATLIEHCRARIARYKCPRAVTYVDELPRLATGKIDKPSLRARFRG